MKKDELTRRWQEAENNPDELARALTQLALLYEFLKERRTTPELRQ